MKKSFDMNDLAERLKAKGLPAIEGVAELVVGEVFQWAEDSLMIHPNALVKGIGLPAVAILKPLAMEAVDKIDGQPG